MSLSNIASECPPPPRVQSIYIPSGSVTNKSTISLAITCNMMMSIENEIYMTTINLHTVYCFEKMLKINRLTSSLSSLYISAKVGWKCVTILQEYGIVMNKA